LSDLNQAGTLEQDADIVAFIYRDEVYNKNKDNTDTGIAEIAIAKNRHGQTGVAYLLFQEAYSRFEDRQRINLRLNLDIKGVLKD